MIGQSDHLGFVCTRPNIILIAVPLVTSHVQGLKMKTLNGTIKLNGEKKRSNVSAIF